MTRWGRVATQLKQAEFLATEARGTRASDTSPEVSQTEARKVLRGSLG
jgi:hypothetical protein